MSNFLSTRLQPAPLEMVSIPFGDWLPDLLPLNSGGSPSVLNVVPRDRGYGPFYTIFPQTGLTLANPCKGGITVNDRYGNNSLYLAEQNAIYRNNGASALVNVFTAGVAHTNPASMWMFVPFGDKLVAIHPEEYLQVNTINVAGNFATLGGSPPKAACGARVKDFLVVGNMTLDVDGITYGSRVRWSAFNNISAPWVTDPTTQADFQDMPTEGGLVQAICGREIGTVFQERIISRMTYVGLPTVFDFAVVEQERGALSPFSVVDMGESIYFIAEDGFFMWNGTNSVPLGVDKVNRWFFTQLNYQERGRIVGAADFANNCIHWAFPLKGSTTLTDIITLNYSTGRWAHQQVTVQYMMSIITGTGAGGFDRQPMAGVDSTNHYGTFLNSTLTAVLETSEFTSEGGERMFVNLVRPTADTSAGATVQLATRDQLLQDNLVYTAAVAPGVTGECDVYGEGRYMRVRLNLINTWTHALGVDLWRRPGGRS